MILSAVSFVVGVVIGAYSHKWLAVETGAPATLPTTVAEAKADAAKLKV